MNINELSSRLTGQFDLSRHKLESIISQLVTEIGGALKAGDEVSLHGLGKLKVKETAARTGRNPATGEVIEIKPSRKVVFSPAKPLRDAVAKTAG